MKKILLSSVALLGFTAGAMAADLPARVAPVAPAFTPVPVFTWTGFYVGLQAGYTWGEDDNDLVVTTGPAAFGGVASADLEGFVGGAHAGFNYQFGSVVAGLEADIEGLAADGDVAVVAPAGTLAISSEINFQGSLRARLGFAFDRALIYATGGLAFVNYDATYAFTPAAGGFTVVDFDDTLWGWTIGAGIEYAITNNITTRVEYRYTQFDSQDNGFNFTGLVGSGNTEPEFHTVRAGISYKF
jgi:outer membrane immunogenic protein